MGARCVGRVQDTNSEGRLEGGMGGGMSFSLSLLCIQSHGPLARVWNGRLHAAGNVRKRTRRKAQARGDRALRTCAHEESHDQAPVGQWNDQARHAGVPLSGGGYQNVQYKANMESVGGGARPAPPRSAPPRGSRPAHRVFTSVPAGTAAKARRRRGRVRRRGRPRPERRVDHVVEPERRVQHVPTRSAQELGD